MNTFYPGVGPLAEPWASTFAHALPDISRTEGFLFFTINEHDRVSIATSIERLIDLLDAMDAEHGFDADLEDNGDDEPSLGWFEAHGGRGHIATAAYAAAEIDAELDTVDCEDGGDREPNLASPECHIKPWGVGRDIDGCQLFWAEAAPTSAATEECEEVNEDGGNVVDEPHDDNGDDEPSLGWRTVDGLDGIGVDDLEASDEPCDAGDRLCFDGSGLAAGRDLLRGMPTLRARIDAFSLAGRVSTWGR